MYIDYMDKSLYKPDHHFYYVHEHQLQLLTGDLLTFFKLNLHQKQEKRILQFGFQRLDGGQYSVS